MAMQRPGCVILLAGVSVDVISCDGFVGVGAVQ